MAVIKLNFKRFKHFHEFKSHKLKKFVLTLVGLPDLLLTFALSNAHSTPLGIRGIFGELLN